VLQTGFELGSGFLPLGSGLESDSKKLESEHLWREYLRFGLQIWSKCQKTQQVL